VAGAQEATVTPASRSFRAGAQVLLPRKNVVPGSKVATVSDPAIAEMPVSEIAMR